MPDKQRRRGKPRLYGDWQARFYRDVIR